MSEYQCGKLVYALDAALKQRPRSVYLRRLLCAVQRRACAVMEAR